MFDYLKGFLVDKRVSTKGFYITLDVLDCGYSLEVNQRVYDKSIINENKKIKIFTSLIHKEDSMTLYGFLNRETRDIFQVLLSVSGVGAKMALALLNEFAVSDLITFVVNGNYKELTLAKGVGPKLAQKIILELKDKLIKTNISINEKCNIESTAISDAKSIMQSLGYTDKEIDDSINKSICKITDINNAEEILRQALLILSE